MPWAIIQPKTQPKSREPQDYISSKDWSSDPCELTDRKWKTAKAAACLCQKCPTHAVSRLGHLYFWIVLIAWQFIQLMLTMTGPAIPFNRGSYLTWPNRNGLPDCVLPGGTGTFSLLQRNGTCAWEMMWCLRELLEKCASVLLPENSYASEKQVICGPGYESSKKKSAGCSRRNTYLHLRSGRIVEGHVMEFNFTFNSIQLVTILWHAVNDGFLE